MLWPVWGCNSMPDPDEPRGGAGRHAQVGAGAGGAGSDAQAGAGAGGTGSHGQAGAGAGGGAGVVPPSTGGAGPFDAGSDPDRNAVTPGGIWA